MGSDIRNCSSEICLNLTEDLGPELLLRKQHASLYRYRSSS